MTIHDVPPDVPPAPWQLAPGPERAGHPGTPPIRVSAGWLAAREAADSAARSTDLVDLLVRRRPAGPWVIHDLGSGTGSMTRWLAPQLTGEQRWILYDRDQELLKHATEDLPIGADTGVITVETRCRDITRLGSAELAGATLITASALLDMLTAAELDRIVKACSAANCPVLMTISVIGRVLLTPADPLDERIGDAFNAHQRRTVGARSLLGPDAVGAAVEAFAQLGHDVLARSSPWQLGPATPELVSPWLSGWVAAAAEQQPELVAPITGYRLRRREQADAGGLRVVVHHHDLLALPR
jgi:hypothetical protein